MRKERVFLVLMVIQALHSIEEYVFRLFESFPPARFVSALVSADPARGFAILNLIIVALGLCCYWWPVRRRWASASIVAWIWVGVEVVNGLTHPAWSIIQRGYTPGLITSLMLLPCAVFLATRLRLDGATEA